MVKKSDDIRVIALYLPQFHPFLENDEWWGKGFTEWRSVARAKPLFKGHYQPHIPADLGFYDLRLPQVREQQAEMARQAGIEGFCYWHYWFGNGKQLMESIFNEVLDSGKPDYPFCLGWANHSWYAKNWNSKDSGSHDKLLIEQKYLGEIDIRLHYEYVLKAFKDMRYIKVDNKPFFMIFDALHLPDNFINLWNKWAIEDGFDGVYFVGNVPAHLNSDDFIQLGFHAVIKNRIQSQQNFNIIKKFLYKVRCAFFNYPYKVFNYKDCVKCYLDENDDAKENVIPCLIPNFDHSPRSGKYGYIVKDSTPELFKKYAKKVFELVNKKQNKIVMLRSWNEWGEGNYMEPDLKWGLGYVNALKEALKDENKLK